MITTDRLHLLPLTRAVLAARIAADRFTVRAGTGTGLSDLSFGPEWPGDPLPAFPFLLDSLGTDPDEAVVGSFVLVERTTGEAVGMAGTKGHADARGVVEIGYSVNPSARGRGLATEAVGALVGHLLGLADVRTVAAETAVGNLASQRVLQSNGFVRTGTSWNEEDGDLLVWARPGPAERGGPRAVHSLR